MLDIKSITVRYGAIEALTDISLTVQPGQFVAVLGANGAGKSTLLRTISGLLHPVSGALHWMGTDIAASTQTPSSAAASPTSPRDAASSPT